MKEPSRIPKYLTISEQDRALEVLGQGQHHRRPAGGAPRAAPLVRIAPARERRAAGADPGGTGPREHQDDDDLRAHLDGEAQGGAGEVSEVRRDRRPSEKVEIRQLYVPMEEWDIDDGRKRHQAAWLSEGWRRAHVVSVPGKPMYLVALERDLGWLRGERR